MIVDTVGRETKQQDMLFWNPSEDTDISERESNI